MKAYSMGISKKDFVKETLHHQKADHFMRGTYDDGEKGCAVGCALKSVAKLKNINLDFNDHTQYEKHLGVPEWLAILEDTIFEGVSLERSKKWPVEFAKAINEGADLDKIKVPFIVYLMKENLKSIRSVKYDVDKNPDVKKAIDMTESALLQMIEAQESGNKEKIEAARSAAWSAARSAESAALSAESAARSAAWSAESAARSAAWSAWSAARSAESATLSAESAAESAARSAWSAASAESAAWSAASAESAAWSAARSAARSAAFERHADKLIKLMKACK